MKISNKKKLATLVIVTLSVVSSLSSVTQAHAAEIQGINLNTGTDKPLYISIPSIKLYSKVQDVGIDKKGNMDVPSGKSSNVGWYKYGTTPGANGTAVLDAHNTAAFKNLKKVPVGSDIYIYSESGNMYHFVVNDAKTYKVAGLSSSVLFTKTPTPTLNLITCAGTLLGNGEATHRLIVSAELV